MTVESGGGPRVLLGSVSAAMKSAGEAIDEEEEDIPATRTYDNRVLIVCDENQVSI